MRRPTPVRDRGGFALALVVLLLFAIAVAGATGYQVISAEFTMAQQNRDGQEALAVARAGLSRFLGEQIGVIGDSVSYAIGDGVAAVTAHRTFRKDSLNVLYYIKSVGQVADPRTPLIPATRTVAAYAWHRMNPITPKAAMMITGGRLYIYGPPYFSTSTVSGADIATVSDCTFGGTVPRYGLAYAGTAPSTVGTVTYTGSPSAGVNYGSFSAMYDTVGVRWDILSDAAFPVDFQNQMPNWSSLPADSFPIVRYDGDLTAYGSYYSGRGVLIVTGQLSIHNDFVWNGIILAGRFYYTSGGTDIPQVNGMLIGGLSSALSTQYVLGGLIRYHSCNVYKANRSLSYLEVVDNSLVELNN